MKYNYTEEDEKRVALVLKEIQSRIPASLIKAAMSEQEATPVTYMVLQKALESETIEEEKKQQIRNLMATGMFSKKSIVEDSSVTKQIDNFILREINKAIRKGLLPPRSHIKHFPSISKI